MNTLWWLLDSIMVGRWDVTPAPFRGHQRLTFTGVSVGRFAFGWMRQTILKEAE